MCGCDWPRCRRGGCSVGQGGDGGHRHGRGREMVGMVVIFDGEDIILVIIG